MKKLFTILLAVYLSFSNNAQAMEENGSNKKLQVKFDKAISTINDEIKQIYLKLTRSAIEYGYTENAVKYIDMFNIDINMPIIEMNSFNTGTTSTYLLQWAAYWENFDAVKLLLEKGANVNQADYNGSTALHEISQSKSLNRFDGMTKDELEAQIEAAKTTVLAIANLLIENGAKISLKDDDGFTPLAHTVISGACNELKKLFLKHGADVKELLVLNEDF